MTNERNFVVTCKSDLCDEDGRGYEQVLSTRRLFTRQEADQYASSISYDRHPRVLTIYEYLTAFEGWRWSAN